MIKFEWDPAKAASNFQDHGVTFVEAESVFYDPLAEEFFDPDHSTDEERSILIGQSLNHRLLFVSFTERGDLFRIISARKLTPAERKDYEDGGYKPSR